MRIRSAIALTVVFILFITIANLFSDNATLLARLPESRIEQARRATLQKPYLQRQHRLERLPRLESAHHAVEAAKEQSSGTVGSTRKGSTFSSQRLRSANKAIAEEEKKRAKYHVVPSVDGSIYTEWQARVCYYWYKKAKEKYPDSAMGGFTRLLHSGKADNLMDEIPTAVVDRLPDGVDQGYVVLNRPFAYLQWVRKFMGLIPEDYVLMAEPDHLFVRPPPLWATPTNAAAYPFTYIQPWKHPHLMNRFNPKNVSVSLMAPIGNAPVQIHKNQLAGIVEKWYNTSLRMKQDSEVDKAFGWILEMYAYSIASSQAEGGPLTYKLHGELMAQPPFDPYLIIQGQPVSIIHLTYGMDYDRSGNYVYGKPGNYFHWDKREYTDRYPPRKLPDLPQEIDAPTVRFLLAAINEAAETLAWRTDIVEADKRGTQP